MAAAAQNKLIEVVGVDKGSSANEAITTTTNPSIPNNLESNTPNMSLISDPEDQNCSIMVHITENQDQSVDDIDSVVSSDPVPDQLPNNMQGKRYSNSQPALRLISNNLSSSLSEGLESMELLLSADHSHGLSSLSLEVMTSGEQLNLLADGLGSSQEGSVHSGENNFLVEDEKVEKSRESCASASDAPGCVEIENQSTSPDESSRCSSSLGCLEPRPSRPTPTDTPTHTSHTHPSHNKHPSPSPKEIHRELLDVLTASTEDGGPVTPSECSCDSEHVQSVCDSDLVVRPRGALVTPSECGSEDVDTLRRDETQVEGIRKSRSTQSLNLFGGSGSRRVSFGSIFNRKKMTFIGSSDHTSQTMLAASSTTGLILHNRPKDVPAKSAIEERRHQRLYEQMMSAARKKDLQRAKEEIRKEEQRRHKDKVMDDSRKEWAKILPKWESIHKSRKVRDLWWHGLPPGIRGEVWKKAIGNDLNISTDLYVINLRRCKERLASIDQRGRSDSSASQKSVSREQSVEGIHLDVLRTFPTLGFFQEGGPYNRPLHDVLGAYACYRPDIGYVQGMSFLAAVLLLNMEAPDAFVTLANLLNRPSYLAFFKVDHSLMKPYFDTFCILLQGCLPKLSSHFTQLEFSPEYYLIEWIFTIYTRVLPLDMACRVWDLFCRDGDSFLYRTALGILRLYQTELLEFNAIEDIGQFLGKLPSNLDSDLLFGHIDSVNITSKKFQQILEKQYSGDTPHR